MKRKGKQAAIVSEDCQKTCSRCDNDLPITKFAKDVMGKFGVTSICKDCRISDRDDKDGASCRKSKIESDRLEKVNNLLAMGPAKKTTCVEDNAVLTLKQVAVDCGVEIRKWHDGTRSDVGIKPTGIDEDLWYPLQIKSTAAVTPKFTWNLGKKAYEIPIILMTGNSSQAFLLYPEDLSRHDEKIKRAGGIIQYGVEAGYWQAAISPQGVSNILMDIKEQWSREYKMPNNGLLSSESVFQMECSMDSQREWTTVEFSRKFSSAQVHSMPPYQSVVDRLEDGIRIQDKSAAWLKRENTPYFKAKCAKLLRGVEVPYEIGDADLFCFAVVIEQRCLFLEWRIPANEMNTMFGRLSHVENGKVSKLGRTCINLPVVGPSGENMALHKSLFGKMPRKDTDLRPALFLKVHNIPSNVLLHECVCGRDPVPCN
jgi:hypothetical protein